MNDLRAQLQQMRKMGGLGALAGMIPGMKKAQAAMAASAVDDKILLRMDAIIGSMTPKERAKPELLNAKRKIRVAKGSGTTVQDVNKLLKMHQEMATAMKKHQEDGRPQGHDGDARQGRHGRRRHGRSRRRRRHGRRGRHGRPRPRRRDEPDGRAARLPAPAPSCRPASRIS